MSVDYVSVGKIADELKTLHIRLGVLESRTDSIERSVEKMVESTQRVSLDIGRMKGVTYLAGTVCSIMATTIVVLAIRVDPEVLTGVVKAVLAGVN